jgi:branched-chain amino acid transport system permease protein
MTGFLQLLFAGFALGCVYALIALGFTVIYRATQVINFAQGAMLLLGAYVTSWLAVDHGLPFWLSVVLAMAVLSAGGGLFQMGVLRRVRGQSIFTRVMITIGLTVVMTAGVTAIWGPNTRNLGDPWGASSVSVHGVIINWVRIWAIMVTAVILAGYFVFDRFTRYGLALRATAADQEAALAVGVPVRRIHAITWVIAGSVATLSGVFLAGYPQSPNPGLGESALLVFPAVILGGLESPVGAVVGGIVIAIVEELVAGYAPGWTGENFYTVAPYIVMILVLLVRPYGLFGIRPVERP